MAESSIFTLTERSFAEALSRVFASNPFLPERIEAERAALGADFAEADADWNTQPPTPTQLGNHHIITERCGALIEKVRGGWTRKRRLSKRDFELYDAVAGFWLYQTFCVRLDAAIVDMLEGRRVDGRVDFFPAFRAAAEHAYGLEGSGYLERQSAEHLFAIAFQVRRAFHNIFRSLVGGSGPMARLRAAIWQSIFSHDLNRYRRVLYHRMGDFATLVTGPSGTGKELVARAIALSRYVAFDPRRGGFEANFVDGFYPLHLAALSPTLVESELFGHRRGAFTGALADRAGWLEVCPPTGGVFLDEIGEVDATIQVKLLRVLQARTFQRLGETDTRHFTGKIIAATNRDLPAEIRAGRFREDFYYRLCSDQVETVSLRAQLDDRPDDLAVMVRHVVGRLLGEVEETQSTSDEAVRWITRNLGGGYGWPGNFRELEQCVRNLVLRGEYLPAVRLYSTTHPWGDGASFAGAGDAAGWLGRAARRTLTAEQLLTAYTRHVHDEAGTVEETARRLDLDRRTVKARLLRG